MTTWLLDGEPVTEAEVFEAAEQHKEFMSVAEVFLRQMGHNIEPILKWEQTKETA